MRSGYAYELRSKIRRMSKAEQGRRKRVHARLRQEGYALYKRDQEAIVKYELALQQWG